ncbi:ATP-binding cassette domain-containing protein [Helcobacillus massiliensis]|uniref:Mycobactin import ATP-binding/permease protein IrtA n=1 Tax=Helcobacillus massiliensis TaxID=521392 RepID=A0A839QSX3_9MICO|nr:SIP domain-containing protein [Helcobacillus massiliensis]MBB3023152.1 iron complex transport system ATP-binding protein [Helcobacillus massiliensis]
MTSLRADHLSLGYDRSLIVDDLSLELPHGEVTIIVGANGSGKSTLLRGLSRLLRPQGGSVLLDGKSIQQQSPKQVARKLGLLPQTPTAPDGITVRDLVGRGRFPHQGLFRSLTAEDHAAVDRALAATGMQEHADRITSELSGGQRQRAWIAMALAQETDLLLLDEPTTFLDVAHQIDVLDVVQRLNRERGTTVAIVLHDLNLAARYADTLVAMKQGAVVAAGAPGDVVTSELVGEVFGLDADVVTDPQTRTPMVVPRRAAAADRPRPVLEIAHSLLMRTHVAQVENLSPTFLRLTLAGPDLQHFGCGAHPQDLRVKVLVPPSADPGRPAGTAAASAAAPSAGARGDADPIERLRPGASCTEAEADAWYKEWLQVPEEVRGVMRTYTVREHRQALHPGNASPHPEIVIDVVRHIGGRASEFLQSVQVGDTVEILGPNRHVVGPDWAGIAFRPGDARHLLLAGDETAAPAILSILEALPASFTGDALIEVPDSADEMPVMTRSAVRVQWLVRGSQPSGALLEDAVRSCVAPPPFLEAGEEPEDIDVDQILLWETASGGSLPFYAWLAGEAGVIKQLRRYLVRDAGIDRTQVSFMGYWRVGRSES